MAVVTTNLGTVTAYGDAVAAGYTGTKAQWQALMADYATVGQQAAQSAQTASTAASTATTKASEASASATAAAASAASIGTPDTTLTQSGKAADAKATGDEISQIKEDFRDILNGLGDDVTPTFTQGKVYYSYNSKVFESNSASYNNGVIDVTEGYNYFVYTGVPSNTAYYGVIFANNSGDTLAQYGQSTSGSPIAIMFRCTAPVGATKMYVNNRLTDITPLILRCVNDAFIDKRVVDVLSNSDLVRYLEFGDNLEYVEQDSDGVYDGFIGGTGKINTTTYDVWNLYRYPVSAGKTYRLCGTDVNIEYNAYSVATFSESAFDGTTAVSTSNVIIPSGSGATNTDYDVTYTPQSDGYIYISQYGTRNTCALYEVIRDKCSKLINKLTGTNHETVKIQIFGDSMSDNIWRKTWQDFIGDFAPQRSWNIVTSAVGGACIGHGKSVAEGGRYQNLEYNFVHDLITNTDVFEADSDIVVMFVGTNDYSYPTNRPLGAWGDNTVSTFFGAARLICEYVTTHSDALFIVCTPLPRYNTRDSEQSTDSDGVPINADGKTLRDYCDALVKTCHLFGVPVVDLNYEIGWNKNNILNFARDGLHPNERGAKIVSAYICEILKRHLGI